MKSLPCLFLLALIVALRAQTPEWRQVPNSSGPSNVRHDDIYFTDATNGWATQNNRLYRTTNGGADWTTNLNMSGTHFRSIAFLNPQVGFAGNLGIGSYDANVNNSNVMYRSIDGGVTWSNVPGFAEVGMKGLCSFQVLNSNTIYGAGRVRGPAFLIRSTDGGNNWDKWNLSASNVMNGIMDVYFRDTNTGWIVGMDTNQYASPPYYGRIARTTNGGLSWQVQVTTTISNCYFWKMSWPSSNVGYCSLQQNAGYNTVVYYKTTDGGNTWVSNGIPLASIGSPSSFYLQGIGFVSTNEGWMGGGTASSHLTSFIRTTNGGANWFSVGYSNTYLLNRIRFDSPTFGYASGAALHLYRVPLALTSEPTNLTVVGPTNVSLSVGAVGSPLLSYQWRKNGANAANGNAATLSLTNILRNDSGEYSVYVSDGFTNIQSSNAILRVLVPERLAQPELLPGNQIRLSFTDADGGAMLTTNDLATFTVFASTNLTDWFTLTNTLTVTNGSIVFEDSIGPAARKFYRVVEH